MPDYRNAFALPTYVEHTIVDQNGNKVGTLRVKPSSLLWKPVGAHSFYAVNLDTFADWMANRKGSRRVRQ